MAKTKKDKTTRTKTRPEREAVPKAFADVRRRYLLLAWLIEQKVMFGNLFSELSDGRPLGEAMGEHRASELRSRIAYVVEAIQAAADECPDQVTPTFDDYMFGIHMR